MAMGIAPNMAQGSLRISLGHLNDKDDISYVLDVLSDVVARLREISPGYHNQGKTEK
jgi:cysteine desulfurase